MVRWFELGLAHAYNFSRGEAIVCFENAGQALGAIKDMSDAERYRWEALSCWGVAYASGTDYNKPTFVTDSEAETAFVSGRRAVRKTAAYRKETCDGESDNVKERAWMALVDALACRYDWGSDASSYPNTSKDYRSMTERYVRRMKQAYDSYKDSSADVCALYAEAMMQLRPWKLWNRDDDGKTHAVTITIKTVLERALSVWPAHIGLCHFYVHLMEMSSEPETALSAAKHLRDSQFGHLAHMPSHIDMQVGNYGDAVEVNQRGIVSDLKLMKYRGKDSFYFGYLLHNIHMSLWASMFLGNYADAMASATQIVNITPESIVQEWAPHLENYLGVSTSKNARLSDHTTVNAPDTCSQR